MSTESHSALSWTFYQQNGPREITLKRTHWLVGYDGGKGVAIVFGHTDAHARLIAAAPELLAACEIVLEPIGIYTDGRDEREARRSIVRAAIAKAKGE